MDYLRFQWVVLSSVAFLASVIFFFFFQSEPELLASESCSLHPHTHFWVSSKRIVTLQGVIAGAVEIKGGKIASIVGLQELQEQAKKENIIDYGEAVIMPGVVDVHVHLDEPGRTEWEGFWTGTKAAAAGGVTSLVDMPLNNNPTTISSDTLSLKIKAAEKQLYVDIGFWGGLVPENAEDTSILEGLLNAGALGVKAFMCPSGIDDFPMSNITHIKKGLSVLAKYRRPLLVHAELQQKITDAELQQKITSPKSDESTDPRHYSTYLKSRPPSMEEAAIRQLVEASSETRVGGSAFGAHLHVVHLSDAGASLSLLKEAKARGDSVSMETCPHYIAFAAEEIKDGDTRFKCAPPIRESPNRDVLWKALLDGDVDMLASDHSPTLPGLKLLEEGDFMKAWGGISSLQLEIPATWTYGRKYGVSLEQMAKWWSEKPAKYAGLDSKGGIVVGKDADLAIWDPEAEIVPNEGYPLFMKHPGNSAYGGLKLYGKVLATFVRGNLVYREEMHATESCGKIILA